MALTIFLAQQNSVIMGNRKFKLGRHNKNEEIRSNPKKVGRPKKVKFVIQVYDINKTKPDHQSKRIPQ
jgi:hypothetical protein